MFKQVVSCDSVNKIEKNDDDRTKDDVNGMRSVGEQMIESQGSKVEWQIERRTTWTIRCDTNEMTAASYKTKQSKRQLYFWVGAKQPSDTNEPDWRRCKEEKEEQVNERMSEDGEHEVWMWTWWAATIPAAVRNGLLHLLRHLQRLFCGFAWYEAKMEDKTVAAGQTRSRLIRTLILCLSAKGSYQADQYDIFRMDTESYDTSYDHVNCLLFWKIKISHFRWALFGMSHTRCGSFCLEIEFQSK